MICDLADKTAQGLNAVLPLKVDEDTTIVKAEAVDSKIIIYSDWSKSRTELYDIWKHQGVTHDQLVDMLQSELNTSVCNGKSTGNFIKLGGYVEYDYKYAGESNYTEKFLLTSCN